MFVTSKQNPKVKQLLLLQQKKSERMRTGLFAIEGLREFCHCLASGYTPATVFRCPQILPDSEWLPIARSLPEETLCLDVAPDVYERIALRGDTEGVVAMVHSRRLTLDQLALSPTPLIVVMESVEKPGNLGAVLRSADAAGADAVVVCDHSADAYNPNTIRSSIGAVFTVPVVECSSDEAIAFLKNRGIQILTAQLQDSRLYYDTDMTRPTAIVMGNEASGLTQLWRNAADAHIRIPMLGHLDSLNLSVSTAILLFEAVRQRKT